MNTPKDLPDDPAGEGEGRPLWLPEGDDSVREEHEDEPLDPPVDPEAAARSLRETLDLLGALKIDEQGVGMSASFVWNSPKVNRENPYCRAAHSA